MVQLYVKKIQNKEINATTGKAWDIEDVPKLWREKVKAALVDM